MALHRAPHEKIKYWERKLAALLAHIPPVDLLKLSWALEALRSGNDARARIHLNFPETSDEHQIGAKYFIPPWNIDGVINERFNLKPESRNGKQLNLRNWGGVAKLFNTYNGLANIESVKDFKQGGILAAMPRLLWPQYNWQLGFDNIFRVGRAWHVYATPEGKEAFRVKHSIDLDRFLKVAFAMFAGTQDYPAVKYSFIRSIGVSNQEIHLVRNVIGKTIEEHFNFAESIRDKAIPIDFRQSITKERPLFEAQNGNDPMVFIPFRSHLLLRITDGLYYDIVHDGDARRSSGERFEELCKMLLSHYLPESYSVEGERDTSYGKSADIFAFERGGDFGAVFECKIRRLPLRILTSPDPWRDYEKDFDDVVKGIVQVWRTHNELLSSDETSFVGFIILFDPWTAMGNSFIQELFNKATAKADALSIPSCSRVNVALVDYADFERCLRSYEFSDICRAARLAVKDDYHGYLLSGVLEANFNKTEKKPRFNYSKLAEEAVPWWGEIQQN